MAQVIEDQSQPVSTWTVTAAPVATGAGRAGRWGRLGLLLALGLVVALVLIAILAPFLAPYDPIKQDLTNAVGGASAQHPLGTDEFGRDVLSRLIWGARPALLGVLVAIATAC